MARPMAAPIQPTVEHRRRPRVAIAFLRMMLAIAIAVTLAAVQPAATSAVGSDCGTYGGFHYAGEYTSHTNGLTQCAAYDGYFGWNGVNGQITTPSTTVNLPDYTIDHTVGWIGAQFNSDTTWLQTGWYTGTIAADTNNCTFGSCVRVDGVYGRYVENQSSSGYIVFPYGNIATGSSTTSHIIYNASTGCWEAWLTYSGGSVLTDCNEPTSGEMVATTEMASNSGGFVTLPLAHFGTSNPNTNQALRLHGIAGWVPWNTTLTKNYTERIDEHGYTPKYVLTVLNPYYWIEAASQ